MFTRESLWRLLGGRPAWPLAWGLAAACLVPWCLPEPWSGSLTPRQLVIGWILAVTALGLLRTRLATLGWMVILGWVTLLGLSRLAQTEARSPTGVVEVEGRISEPWIQRPHARLGTLHLTSPATLAGMDLGLRLPAEGETTPPPGTPVRLRAALEGVEGAPAFLGERPWWRALDSGRSRRVSLRSASQLEVLGPPSPDLLLQLRTRILARFQSLPLDPTARDLWGALTLGIAPAQEDVFSAFAESGTLHVLVVSGLQVTLVAAVLEALLRRTLRRGSSLGAATGALLYALTVGLSAPVWRGLLMALAWLLGRSRGWALPPALTLHGALFLWLLVHPAAGCDPGFLLAWSALLGLFWGAPALEPLVTPALGRLAEPLAGLTAPWLSTLPLLALLHGSAPLWGIPANALLLPLVSLLTPVCLALTLLPWQTPAALLSPWLSRVGTWLVPAFASVQPLATAWVWPWITLALGWLALAHAKGTFRRTRALATTLTLLSLLLLARGGLGRKPTTFTLEAVDIGQGDALLIQIPQGGTTVVDTGPSPRAARRLVRVLSRRGVRGPIHLVVTHPHGDHAGGWDTLRRLWPLAEVAAPVLGRAQEAWDAEGHWHLGRTAMPFRRGEGWWRGEGHFEVRWPPRPMVLPDLNMASLVLRVRWKDRELWLMGDSLGMQERDLLALGEPGMAGPMRLLKPGHHGGHGTCDPDWIQALSPDLAVLTAGKDNTFGFPAGETLQILQEAKIRALQVGQGRGARILAQPGGWRVEHGTGRWETIPTRRP